MRGSCFVFKRALQLLPEVVLRGFRKCFECGLHV